MAAIYDKILGKLRDDDDIATLKDVVDHKQDLLVSGQNIKTVNGRSILGAGNLEVDGHFKGWFDSLDALQAAYPTPVVGDYAYIHDQEPETSVSIWRCNTAGSWLNSGYDVDTSLVETFKTGQALNEVGIDETQLVNPEPSSLPKATDVMKLSSKLHGIDLDENKVEVITAGSGTNFVDNYKVQGSDGNIVSNSNYGYIEIEIDRNLTDSLRFLGINQTSSSSENAKNTGYAFGHYNGKTWVTDESFYFEATAGSQPELQEYFVKLDLISANATHFRTIARYGNQTLTIAQFYLYLQSGDGVIGTILKNADKKPKYNSDQVITSGAVFDNLITGYQELTDIPLFDYPVRPDGTFGTSTSSKHGVIPVKEGEQFIISNYQTDSNIIRYAFATSNTYSAGSSIPLVQGTSVIIVSFKDTLYITIPKGTLFLLTNSISIGKIWKKRNNQLNDKKEIKPLLVYEAIKNSTGAFSEHNGDKRILSTPRYIGVSSNSISIKADKNCYCRVYQYDSDFTFITSERKELTANTFSEYDINCSYLKLSFVKDSDATLDIPILDCSVVGLFPEGWDTFNPRPLDSGYQRIIIHPNVTNPTCCDDESNNIQDSEELLVDYGVIALPEKYTNSGSKTRLIIYCHGAAVNYDTDVNRFDTDDLDAAYWLSEGYAVMDVEGNPYNNTDEHLSIPQAQNCYVAAYKWAIEHFNLKRDGIFLGGRSMGGNMVLDLMRDQCPIPIIAAVANVPTVGAIGTGSSERKAFFALHCGFDVPESYTWGNLVLTTTDKQVYLDNWDKLIKNIPIMGMVTDLPVTNEYKESFIDCFFTKSNDRVDLWKTLHAKARCPIKLFGCNSDETCPPQYTSSLLYRMFINAGQNIELRLFNSTYGHHYELQDPGLIVEITNSYGVTVETSVVYIEMLQFWRRYEQLN